VEAHTTKDAVLFLWVTAPLLLQNPGPRDVIEAWGFTYKTGAVWDKVVGMYGHYFHIQHEHLLVCTRGSCTPDVPTPSPKSVFTERRTTHSKKPAGIRRVIERMYNRGPYVELFGREAVEGWDVLGNDARLWGAE
jgi:N6-adenosine-specific RNA methylase IME4